MIVRHVAAGEDEPSSHVCPLTGRLGVWTATRETRPRHHLTRQDLVTPGWACPFCAPAPDDPRLLGVEEVGPQGRWFGLENIYPPLEGATGGAVLAVGDAHHPSLAHRWPGLEAAWTTQLTLQTRLAGMHPERWSLLSTAVGMTAGASQQHPHGQVLVPSQVPPAVVRMQQQLAREETIGALLDPARCVDEHDEVLLVAPPVPLGPGDLLLVPTRPGRLVDLPAAAVARLVVSWLGRVHRRFQVDQAALDAPSPIDIKTLLHDALPDGTGRWVMELQVTDRHAPGVAAAPLVDLVRPPDRHAAWFRSADRSA